MIALGIAASAVILFIGTGGALMPRIVRSWTGMASTPDLLLTNALLLNIALLIFGWRRYRDLRAEIAERRQAEQQARQLAETDPLTNCLNRRSLIPAINALCATAHAQDRQVAVLLMDLDNFKQINDLNGHTIGDTVLTTVANRLRRLLPAECVLARIGGDEFVCATSVSTEERVQLDALFERLVAQVSEPIEVEGIRVEVTISVGVATSLASDEQAEQMGEDLVHKADIAMYQAKRRGRNCYAWFEPAMEAELRFRNQLESAIREALPNGEFVPYYEQQIELETGKLIGFEMLARWHSPRYGLVSPENFIPIAEEIDLIGAISDSLMRQALQDAREWDPSLSLSVNVSPVQLRDPWFAQKIVAMLNDYQFPHDRFELEITEACLYENIGATRALIASMKNQGIRVSLDDFGTGYSSVAQLRGLQFDRLKIDRSFVRELQDSRSGDLVEAMINLGKSLSLPVTAEGVETDKVLTALKKIGGIKGQGHVYGMPEDAKSTLRRLHSLGMLAGQNGTASPPSSNRASA